ncbi:hypothetical protein ACFQ09_12675 [Massilia norwichensis]|uniref:Uncharacterized protein n=1 Tax=Massilia norwichensis TaxID=1442366 RepID=A0ABT2ACK1_9BURK|nr:hypothetical protein [Massilia norwichensis]MCS0591835.1 hypothetical protein [Massilia norwichensis]
MKIAATTTATTSARASSESAIRRVFRAFCAELRRGIELTGQKYLNGMVPPL